MTAGQQRQPQKQDQQHRALASSPQSPAQWIDVGEDDCTIPCTTDILIKDVSVDEECWDFIHYQHRRRRTRRNVRFNLRENQVRIVERISETHRADVWYSKQQLSQFRYQTQQQASKIAQTAHEFGSFGDTMHRLFHAFRSNQNENEGSLYDLMRDMLSMASSPCDTNTTTNNDNNNNNCSHHCNEGEEDDETETYGLETMAVPAIQSDYQIRRRYLMGQIHRIQQKQQQHREQIKRKRMINHSALPSSSSILDDNVQPCCLATIRDTSRMASRASTLFAQFLAQQQRGHPHHLRQQQQLQHGVLRHEHVLV